MIKERFISGLFGAVLFFIFQPFGLSHFGWMRWPLLMCISCLILVICLVSEYILRYVIRMPNDQNKGPQYMMKRNIVYQIINIIMSTTSICLYLHFFANNEQVDNHFSVKNVLFVFGIVLFVHFLLGLYWKNVYWKRHYAHQLEEAQRLNGILQERARHERNKAHEKKVKEAAITMLSEAEGEEITAQDKPILLEGATKESVSLTLDTFLFAESDGNYVSVHYLIPADDEEMKAAKAVIRTSIKSVATALCIIPSILQCHRAFIVNLSFVKSVEGRSSGIGLEMMYSEDIIPVSKSYVREVKEKIQNPE